MKHSHPVWQHLFIPALNGRRELVCRRYENLETDGAGHALSARALLALGHYTLSAKALYHGLIANDRNAHVLGVQIGFHKTWEIKNILHGLSEDQKHLLELHQLSNLNATKAIKKLVRLKHVGSCQIAHQWLAISANKPEFYWGHPISVAQQHLKRKLLPHPRLGGYSGSMLKLQPLNGFDSSWQNKLFRALSEFTQKQWPAMAIEGHHQHRCNGR
jgi:hypothetical protein